jgi:hypothetical protein
MAEFFASLRICWDYNDMTPAFCQNLLLLKSLFGIIRNDDCFYPSFDVSRKRFPSCRKIRQRKRFGHSFFQLRQMCPFKSVLENLAT